MLRQTTRYEAPLRLAAERAMQFLESLESRPVRAVADGPALRDRLQRRLSDEGMPPERAIERLVEDVEDGLLGSQGGRFFAWVIGGALPSALAADWLTAAWGQNATLYATSPAASIVEEVTGEWLKALLGLRASASFAFVTGSQMAHATCLAAARHALLHERGWDVETRGLREAPEIRILCSTARHASIDRAARLLGIGSDAVIAIEPSQGETLGAERLAAALAQRPRAATIVVLAAGEINTGAFDDFAALVPVAKRFGAWVHVDGAFGLWTAASPRYRHLTEGVAGADSWTTDGHKWLNVPFDCAYAFVAYPQAHRASFTVGAPYIALDDRARDQIDWTPEWSRRARGFATYAALLELGRNGVAAMIERSCRHAAALFEGIAGLDGAEALWRPTINQGLVRFPDARADATPADHDRRTDDVVRRICETGEAFFAATTWRGMRAMRVSVVNAQTTERDVQRAIAAVAEALQA